MPADRPGSRRAWFWLAMLALTAGAVEATSALAFQLLRPRFVWADASSFAIEPWPGLAELHDAELGWLRRYPTPLGERPRARDRGRPWAVAFGDSFVHGDEVEDAEAWCESLARRAGADVLNFGVSGFAPDQALLYFRRLGPACARSRVLLVGAAPENINRVVNVYRPFYAPGTGIPLTKPRFVLQRGRLELLPNPVRTAGEVGRLADPRFLAEIGRHDHWFAGAGRPRWGPPFCRLLVDPALWRQVGGGGRKGDAPRSADLWRDDGARALYIALLEAFASEARAAGLEPVWLVAASTSGVTARFEGRPRPGAGFVRRHGRARGVPVFDGDEAVMADSEATGRAVGAYFAEGGHLSPAGSEVFADALWRFLEERGLGPR